MSEATKLDAELEAVRARVLARSGYRAQVVQERGYLLRLLDAERAAHEQTRGIAQSYRQETAALRAELSQARESIKALEAAHAHAQSRRYWWMMDSALLVVALSAVFPEAVKCSGLRIGQTTARQDIPQEQGWCGRGGGGGRK